MKYKLLATLITALMLVSPVIGFWHPPPPPPGPLPPCTYMGTLINGNYTWAFAEPVDGFCENFEVKVYIANVTDMYGYEFAVWYSSTYFNLVSFAVATNIWAAQAIIFNGTIATGNPAWNAYKQVVTALPPSTGVSGDFVLATLTFHIMNDVCPDGAVGGPITVEATKVSNSCSGAIKLCSPIYATWTFTPVMPYMWIEPVPLTSSIVGEKNTISVLLKNAVKMTDFTVEVAWNMYLHLAVDCNLTGLWSTLLTTNKASVVLNSALFNASTASITVHAPDCGVYSTFNDYGYVLVDADTTTGLILNLTYPSETIWLFNVTFTKCDAWYSGAQPEYAVNVTDHTYVLEMPSTPIVFYQIYELSTLCGPIVPLINGTTYTFKPIPGDLDGSGHVDITDLMIEAGYYGHPVDCLEASKPAGSPPNGYTWFYDLNNDLVIDIYDIVVVAKNFCRTTP